MKITFRFETISFIIAEFHLQSEIIKIGHSGLYEDKFQELLNVFFNIYNYSENNELIYPYNTEIIWSDSYINYKWILNLNSPKSNLNIKIIELYESNENYEKLLINEELTLTDMYSNIYLSLNKILKEHGFIGYKKMWDVGNFPIGEYLLLKAHKYNLNLDLEFASNSDNGWKQKNKEKDELKVLLFQDNLA